MNELVYLGLSILELSKTVVYEFQFGHVKPKYGEKGKLWYMNTDSFIVYIKIDIYRNIAEDAETNFEQERPLPKGENKKVIGLMKDKLDGKIMTEFVRLRARTYSYLIDDVSENKKRKKYKNVHYKKKLEFENYKKYLEATQLENKISHLEKNKMV